MWRGAKRILDLRDMAVIENVISPIRVFVLSNWPDFHFSQTRKICLRVSGILTRVTCSKPKRWASYPKVRLFRKDSEKKKRHHSVSDKLAARSSVLCLLYFSGGTQGPFCHRLQSNLNEKERKDKILHQEGFKNTFVEARWWTRLNGWSLQCFFNDELHREALRCLGQQWTVTQLRITRRRQWVHARSVDWLAHYKYEFLCCFCRERGRMHGHGERQAAICVCPFDHQFNCTSYPISEWKADW